MLTVITAIAFLLAGQELSRRLWPAGQELYERWSAAILIALALWIGSSWAFALTSTLTRTALIVRLIVVAAVVVVTALPRLKALTAQRQLTIAPPIVALASVAFVWLDFILWRGWVIPPVSHDALAYHLPRAVWMMRARGWRYLSEALDWRIRDLPANYELLLSETLLLQGNDRISEWLSVLFYVGLVLAAGAIARRWWGRMPYAAEAVMAFTAGIPVLLLHSGAHKNDVMTGLFMLNVLLWSGRFLATGEVRSLSMAIIAGALGVGTKPQAAAVVIAVIPFLIKPLLRRPRAIPRLALVALIAFLLLGGWSYVSAAVNGTGMPTTEEDPTRTRYGVWRNLWEAPYVLIAAPFSTSKSELTVPWSAEPWFWQRYEIFFSHLGIPFVLALASLPLAITVARRMPDAPIERTPMIAAAVLALAMILPVEYEPHGFYTISLPRYVIYFAAVLFAWTIPPVISVAARRFPSAPAATVYAGCLAFAIYAFDFGANDRFTPIEYVLAARNTPGTRVVPFEPYRAASVVDRMAGPRDRIAIDGGYGTWIHPAFGADLQRPVELITPRIGPPAIPANADWIVVDRLFNIVWRHPKLDDLSRAYDYFVKGQASDEDLRVIRALRHSPDYQLVFYNRATNQAVFRRRPPH